jgi:hypothetical protein
MDVADMLTGYAEAGLGVLPLHSISPKTGRCTCWPLCWRCTKAVRDGVARDATCTCGGRDCGKNAAKHPRTRHGKDDATTDLGQIAEWLATWPGCNWGVRPPEGVVVLDIDPRNGGDITLAELEMTHGKLPRTLTAITGSGGYHIWLTYDGTPKGKLGEGIDIKSHSGYLVAPPSVHASGGTYAWTDQRPAAYAPTWVHDLMNPPRATRHGRGGGLDALVRRVEKAGEGERNSLLFWAACRAAERGLDPQPLRDVALRIGLDERETDRTITSALRTIGVVA